MPEVCVSKRFPNTWGGCRVASFGGGAAAGFAGDVSSRHALCIYAQQVYSDSLKRVTRATPSVEATEWCD
eukprot:1792118-Amphidinium_carterae.1